MFHTSLNYLNEVKEMQMWKRGLNSLKQHWPKSFVAERQWIQMNPALVMSIRWFD